MKALTIHIFIPTPSGYAPLEEAIATQKKAEGEKILKALAMILCERE